MKKSKIGKMVKYNLEKSLRNKWFIGLNVLFLVISIVTLNFGAIGAAYATMISHFLIFIVVWYLSNKVFPLPWGSAYKNISRKDVKCIVMNPNGEIVNEIPCSGFLHIYYGDSEYMFALKPGEGAMNGLVYIEKSNIETIKEWTQISKSEIEIYSGRGSD